MRCAPYQRSRSLPTARSRQQEAPLAASTETILVVEDDKTLALGLKLNLQAEGFEVVVARDGDAGLREALDSRPHLIVLDLMLPELDGLAVLAHLRDVGREMPVIILSARAELEDKVKGLGFGADDYVTKPFSIQELTARIHAALRRARQRQQRFCFGDIEIDLGARRVQRNGDEVALTSREFELLAYFIDHRGRVQSRDRLLSAVWKYDYEGTARTVDNFVRSLRVKLEKNPRAPEYFVTVRGGGYRFDG